jgi:hypothetical protein
MSSSSSFSTVFQEDRVHRYITVKDLENILHDLSCSNRARIAPHMLGGPFQLSFLCHVYYDSCGYAFVRFTNDDRRTFIKLARIGLSQTKFPYQITYYSSIPSKA